LTSLVRPDSLASTAAAARPDPAPAVEIFDFLSHHWRSGRIGRNFWRCAARRWTSFNRAEIARCVRAFSPLRPYWSAEIFADEDRAFYDSLPEAFTVYRGQNGAEALTGRCFSLSQEVARAYAFGRRNFRYAEPCVIALAATKRDVALAVASRGESEVVLFRGGWVNARTQAFVLSAA